LFDALPVNERNALLGVKGLSASPSKSQPVLRASSNEASSVVEIVDNASDDKQSEMSVNGAGDENQMAARKTGRAKTTIDPEKAVEKAAKVSAVVLQVLWLTDQSLKGEGAARKKGCQGREGEKR
jgi:hypothetical protein